MKLRIFILVVLLLVLSCVLQAAIGKTLSVNIDNPAGIVLRHYPVELRLNEGNFDFTKIDSGFTSLRIRGIGNKYLDYWIEHLDYANNRAVIWIKIPEIPLKGTFIHLIYSTGNGTPYQAASIAPRFNRPADGLTLVTYPADVNSNPMQMLHPSVCKAQGWTRFAKTSDEQNVFWTMTNTPYSPTGLLPAGWTKDLTECPGLWVSSNADPTTDNWTWPTGTANWPQDDSGDAFNDALHRVHATLHPLGTNSNLIVAPAASLPWSDPTIIWIEATQALRVYFRYNTTGYPMYFCDITSPVDGAWADDNGVSHLAFTYGQCLVAGTAWGNTHFDNMEALSPSIFMDGGKFYCVTAVRTSPTTQTYLYTLKSDDGINWTKLNNQITAEFQSGAQKQIYHPGVCVVGDKWYLLGSNGVESGFTRDAVYCWISSDKGATWDIELPNAVSRQFSYSDANKTRFADPYRVWPIYDNDVFYLVVGCRQTGDEGVTVAGDLGGTFMAKDTTFTGLPRAVPNVSSVFWQGAVDFKNDVFRSIATAHISWPITTRNSLGDTTTTVYALDTDALTIGGPDGNYKGITYAVSVMQNKQQHRFRIKGSNTNVSVVNSESKPYATATNSAGAWLLRVRGDDTYAMSITGNTAVTTAATFDLRTFNKGGQMSILNNGTGLDVYAGFFDALDVKVVDAMLRNTYKDNFNVYWHIIKPAYGRREPQCIINLVPRIGYY